MARPGFAVVNPAAGGGRTGRLWPGIARRLATSGVDVRAALTTTRGDATRLARRAVADGYPLVVAVGGDGTINEVVNGIVTADGRARAVLGIVPTGRGRDACRNLGVPRETAAAIEALARGRETTTDLGRLDGADGPRLFVNAAGAGFDADVARRAGHTRGTGTAPYLLALVQALVHHRPRAASVDGDVRWSGRATAIVVANGACYGGGMRIAPYASATDAALDVVVLGDIGRVALVRWLPRVYRGAHVHHRAVHVARASAVRVDAPVPLPVHVDGEPVGTTPVSLSILPAALTVRC